MKWITFGRVEFHRNSDGSFFVSIPLCPSTNARMGVFRGRALLSKSARLYFAQIVPALVYIKKALGLTPVDEYTINEIWIVMGRSNADCHNYFKIAYDCLESAGIVTDDKYLIPRVQGIGHDGKNPTIVMRLGAK